MKVLFVTWDGPQVSYLEGLFLPIFRRLAEHGWEFHVLQFTWGDNQCLQNSHQACAEAGVPYRSVCVWRKPVGLGSFITCLLGSRNIRTAIRDWDINVVMPRSTLPALASLLALHRCSLPMVFDADGLPLDERVDFAGKSSSGLVYRILRDIEAQTVRRADRVITRTRKSVDVLQSRAGAGVSTKKFYVVGNGRDSTQFQPFKQSARESTRDELGIPHDSPVLVYAGSLGDQYCVPEMLHFFDEVRERRPDAHLLVLTGSPEKIAVELARFPSLEQAVTSMTVEPNEVARYLACADIGLALRRRSFSMQGVAPIKLGEYLLCGVPVLATDGIGDTSSISPDVGYLVDEPDANTLDEAATWFIEEVLSARKTFRTRCREVAVTSHSLEASVESYRQALESIGS